MGQVVVEFMSGPLDGQIVILPLRRGKGSFTIGREEDCDVVVPYDDRVSRRHARLTVDGGACTLADTNSRNGTYFDANDQPITGPVPLAVGALFRLGRTRLRVRELPV